MSRPTRDFLACPGGDGTTSVAAIAQRLEISEEAAGSLVAILVVTERFESAASRPHREEIPMAEQEQGALWADANRRVLGDLTELSIAAVKESARRVP